MQSAIDPLIGRHFQSVKRGAPPEGEPLQEVTWQGRIIGSPQPGYYLIQLLDFARRGRNVQRLVTIDMMLSWEFYEGRQEMLEQ